MKQHVVTLIGLLLVLVICTSPVHAVSVSTTGGIPTYTVLLTNSGVVGDARVANTAFDAVTSVGSTNLTSATGNFKQSDVGKALMVPGAGTDGLLIGYGVSSGTINRTTGASCSVLRLGSIYDIRVGRHRDGAARQYREENLS